LCSASSCLSSTRARAAANSPFSFRCRIVSTCPPAPTAPARRAAGSRRPPSSCGPAPTWRTGPPGSARPRRTVPPRRRAAKASASQDPSPSQKKKGRKMKIMKTYRRYCCGGAECGRGVAALRVDGVHEEVAVLARRVERAVVRGQRQPHYRASVHPESPVVGEVGGVVFDANAAQRAVTHAQEQFEKQREPTRRGSSTPPGRHPRGRPQRLPDPPSQSDTCTSSRRRSLSRRARRRRRCHPRRIAPSARRLARSGRRGAPAPPRAPSRLRERSRRGAGISSWLAGRLSSGARLAVWR
ncbi:Oxygen-regulated protein 1, partial [Frankliniella fusca]